MSTNKLKADQALEVLEKIDSRLEEIAQKLDRLIAIQTPPKEQQAQPEGQPLDVMTLLSMPDHLRKTAMIVFRLGKATATGVSKESKRARAVESNYLNQLVGMGHLKRERRGRDVYFYA